MAATAKKTKKAKGTLEQAVIVRALDRAKKSIESRVELPAIAAGAYGVDAQVHICGDVVVGEATAAGKAPKVETGEILGAVLAVVEETYGDCEIDWIIGEAYDILLDDKGHEDAKDALECAKVWAKQYAENLGYTKPVPARAGSVSGMPSVQVSGLIGQLAVEMDIGEDA